MAMIFQYRFRCELQCLLTFMTQPVYIIALHRIASHNQIWIQWAKFILLKNTGTIKWNLCYNINSMFNQKEKRKLHSSSAAHYIRHNSHC